MSPFRLTPQEWDNGDNVVVPRWDDPSSDLGREIVMEISFGAA